MKRRIISAAALLLVLSATVTVDLLSGTAWGSCLLIALILCLGGLELYALLVAREGATTGSARQLAVAAISALCVALPGSLLLVLRLQSGGVLLVLFVVAVAKMTDNGALFAGKAWGRHLMAPRISPGKTWEGLAGGLLVAVLTSTLLGPICTGESVGYMAGIGCVLAPAAVLGDLGESMIKRSAGAKDSGTLMPGIGGILDLIDSVLPCAVLGYLFFVLI
jgi:phosphatidate cytidylyltransferase